MNYNYGINQSDALKLFKLFTINQSCCLQITGSYQQIWERAGSWTNVNKTDTIVNKNTNNKNTNDK